MRTVPSLPAVALAVLRPGSAGIHRIYMRIYSVQRPEERNPRRLRVSSNVGGGLWQLLEKKKAPPFPLRAEKEGHLYEDKQGVFLALAGLAPQAREALMSI